MSELEAFRAQVRAWLAERYPEMDPAKDDERGDTIARASGGHAAMVNGAIELQKALYAAGFWATRLPVEYGGKGLTRAHDDVVAEELMRFDCPSLRPLGIGMGLAMPTILGAAGEEQKRRFLPKLVSAEEVWCQLFSEPDAGSDLVSLRCKAFHMSTTRPTCGPTPRRRPGRRPSSSPVCAASSPGCCAARRSCSRSRPASPTSCA